MSDINYGGVLEALNDKADRDLNNRSNDSGLRKLVESYSSGTSWYKVFDEIQSDGTVRKWCEQGGYGTHVSPFTVTFLKTFRDTDYTLLFSQYNTYGSVLSPSSKNTTGFQSGASTGSGQNFYWMACGYIA